LSKGAAISLSTLTSPFILRNPHDGAHLLRSVPSVIPSVLSDNSITLKGVLYVTTTNRVYVAGGQGLSNRPFWFFLAQLQLFSCFVPEISPRETAEGRMSF